MNSQPSTSPTRHQSCKNPTSTSTSTWSTNLHPVTIKPFLSHVGPRITIPNSPLQVFELFFTPPFLTNIVQQSNLYAKQVMGDIKYQSWTKITVEELKAYFGFILLMGMVPLPSVEDYWKRDPVFHYLPISDHISRDRFRDISRYLHFVNNNTLVPRGQPGHDRLGKVRPAINHLSQRFSELYDPHCELAVDEAMIKFQGRSSLKQYMPMKPIKRGIKVWVLGDSHNGYFQKFQIYSGKEGSREVDLGARVVKTLTDHLHGKFHHIFFDNFFTSLKLLQDLGDNGLYGCGTVRKHRIGFPPTLKTIKLTNRYNTINLKK